MDSDARRARHNLRLCYIAGIITVGSIPLAVMSLPVFKLNYLVVLAALTISIPGYRRAAMIVTGRDDLGNWRFNPWARVGIRISLLASFVSSWGVAFLFLASFPRGHLWAWWKMVLDGLFAVPACTTALCTVWLWARLEAIAKISKIAVVAGLSALLASVLLALWPTTDRYVVRVQCVERGYCWDAVENRCRNDIERCPSSDQLNLKGSRPK